MIYQLKGRIISKNGLLVIIEVNGIGYGVFAPMSTVLKLPDIGNEVLLHTHLIIREDAHLIYGFLEEREKLLFCELIKISGFGPKLALIILSHLTIEQFIQIVSLKDISKLVDIPGIGQKTAERLIIEMQTKVNNKKFAELLFNNNSINHTPNNILINQNLISDAEEALVSLGYKQKEAMSAIKSIMNNQQDSASISSEHLIKLALKNLSKIYI